MPIFHVCTNRTHNPTDQVNAAYFKLNDGWVEFKGADHRLIRAYAPGEVRDILVGDEPDGKVVFDRTVHPRDFLSAVRNTLGEGAYQHFLNHADNCQAEFRPPKASVIKPVGTISINVKPDVDSLAVQRAGQRIAAQGST